MKRIIIYNTDNGRPI